MSGETCATCGDPLDGGPDAWFSLTTSREVCEESSTRFHEPTPAPSIPDPSGERGDPIFDASQYLHVEVVARLNNLTFFKLSNGSEVVMAMDSPEAAEVVRGHRLAVPVKGHEPDRCPVCIGDRAERSAARPTPPPEAPEPAAPSPDRLRERVEELMAKAQPILSDLNETVLGWRAEYHQDVERAAAKGKASDWANARIIACDALLDLLAAASGSGEGQR